MAAPFGEPMPEDQVIVGKPQQEGDERRAVGHHICPTSSGIL